jgi:AraC family transcriptional regulator of adaptative response/methylated-DNA-[protein]-cysteine methyltransferase
VSDYERIADVIRFLDEHHREQPGLAALAARLGLSESRFHRLFSAWAGVTPKHFLQCLTWSCAKQSLLDGSSVLNAALDAGLSGPGRLHDLAVGLEAASPGEMKSGGAGWTLRAGFAESPFGRCLVAGSPRGICHLSFREPGDDDEAGWRELGREWPNAGLRRDDAAAADTIDRLWAQPGEGRSGPALRAFVRGTAFQLRVWRALLRIPPGRLVTYGRLAAAIGNPAAGRAVGAAVARNPVACLIPCHRVIRETGAIGGYRWGPVRKRALVAWEVSHGLRGASALS